ncbi:deoxynucleotidyltransferase terminal-interacting protein 2-like [Anoplophora glabripennis]|uniref:deoxynucleotidyltransferase terminal-interacting protein 2-like n=1 Tax=Anoplophora glabripennis TaxID=217634 RepID=UPI000C790B43|nr:deoxynucleotidyltransferase terminal-interacting protein 2-like [Anoplophora glabripennis]
MDFIIDTVGESDEIREKKNEAHESFISELLKDYKDTLVERKPKEKNKKENILLKEILDDFGQINKKYPKVPRKHYEGELDRKSDIDKVLSKSILLNPEFEKLHAIPPFEVSEKKIKEQRKRERQKTKGKEWFGLPATEMNEEVKHDLEILQMRSVLDPKRFYKKNDLKVLPKYFKIGKVMDSPLDYYNNRIAKKQRKNTLVEELLADAEFNKYNKRKYKEIIEEKQKTHYKAWRQAKKLKKKK